MNGITEKLLVMALLFPIVCPPACQPRTEYESFHGLIVNGHVCAIKITDSINEFFITEPGQIGWIVDNFNDCTRTGQTACPFGYLKVIFIGESETTEVFYAADSCPIFRCQKRYYILDSEEFNFYIRRLMREHGVDDHFF